MDTAAGRTDPTATTGDQHSTDWLRVGVIASADRTATRLVLIGELDRTTTEVLHRSVAEVLRGPAPATLEIDAGALSFLDSSGIRGLLVCRKIAEAAGSRLLVVDPAPHVYRILEITGLLDLFAVRRRPAPATSGPDIGWAARPGMHPPRTTDEVREQSARLRQTTRETRQHAAAVSDDDALRSLRVPGRPPHG